MSVGDVNSNEKGSGARYNSGKPDFSLIPLCTMEDEVRVWAYGKKKYAAWNWAKGMDWDVPFSCLMRHMAAWQRGEENDEESGLPHLAHAMCNLRMLTLYSKTFKEGDHRPTEWLTPPKTVEPVGNLHSTLDNNATRTPTNPTTLIDANMLVGGDFKANKIEAHGIKIETYASPNREDTHGWTADKRG